MLESIEKLSDAIEQYRTTNGSIKEPAMGIGLKGRIFRVFNNITYSLKMSLLFKSTTAACNGYVALMNLKLYKNTKLKRYSQRAIKSLDWIVKTQSKRGFWYYNIPGWKNKIALVDGDTAALALFNGYLLLKNSNYLKSALKWCDLIISRKCYNLTSKKGLCFNYFINEEKTSLTPNVTTFALRVLGNAYQITRDNKYIKLTPKAIKFLKKSQLSSGELRYNVDKEHYRCPQYNAFEFLDLNDYYECTNDKTVINMMKKIIEYLIPKVNIDGSVPFSCNKKLPLIYYHSTVVGAALAVGYKLINKDICLQNALKCAKFVTTHQLSDGAIPYGKKTLLKIFNEKISYPRVTAFIGYHLSIINEELKRNKSKLI